MTHRQARRKLGSRSTRRRGAGQWVKGKLSKERVAVGVRRILKASREN